MAIYVILESDLNCVRIPVSDKFDIHILQYNFGDFCPLSFSESYVSSPVQECISIYAPLHVSTALQGLAHAMSPVVHWIAFCSLLQ